LNENLAAEGIDTFYLSGQTKPKIVLRDGPTVSNDGEKEFFLISLKAGGTGFKP